MCRCVTEIIVCVVGVSLRSSVCVIDHQCVVGVSLRSSVCVVGVSLRSSLCEVDHQYVWQVCH